MQVLNVKSLRLDDDMVVSLNPRYQYVQTPHSKCSGLGDAAVLLLVRQPCDGEAPTLRSEPGLHRP